MSFAPRKSRVNRRSGNARDVFIVYFAGFKPMRHTGLDDIFYCTLYYESIVTRITMDSINNPVWMGSTVSPVMGVYIHPPVDVDISLL